MNGVAANFARVLVPSPLVEALVYRVPEQLRNAITVGSRVLIPLGKRMVTGIAIELLSTTTIAHTKDIAAALDDRAVLDGDLIRLIHWVSQYYVTSLGEVLSAVLPSNLRVISEPWVKLKVKNFPVRNSLEQQIVQLLCQRSGTATVKYLARHTPEFSAAKVNQTLAELESAGAITTRERLVGRSRRAAQSGAVDAASDYSAVFTLSGEQSCAFQTIADRLDSGGFETFLLHGVTGSGKTEVYLRAMETTRSLGRQSLILVPEISLTPQLIDRVSARFPGRVGVLHSGLTRAQRWTCWWSIARGEVDVVVGARSAVFAPLPKLGLIIVDEEHDSSYKQEEGLRYNGRDVAVVRGKICGVAVVLGSATPAIESYENTVQGRYRLLEIRKRVNERPLPRIEIVDLRHQARPQTDGKALKSDLPSSRLEAAMALISPALAEALTANFAAQRQSLIFLNRRGFANFLQCRVCGAVLRCAYCSVTLTVHLKQRRMRCHHCDFHRPLKTSCPDCGEENLRPMGVGTEQIEEAIKRLLPMARVARMDRDTTSRRGSHHALLRSWEKGELDILIGTQMVTKGHDVSGVTLVGALLADLSLNLPDFRSGERTFQLLSQVAGRAGRGSEPGKVIVQTYAPDHYAIQHLLEDDYREFFRSEIEFRRALNYPPFTRLVQLRVDGPKAGHVEGKIKELNATIRRWVNASEKLSSQIEVLGPAPAPIEKLRNRHRWQLLIKGKQIPPLLHLVQQARDAFPRSRSWRLHVDVDPYSML